MPRTNRIKEAFRESYNLVGLATAASLSAVMLSPFPFLAGLVAETAYLLFIPDSKWYSDRLDKKATEAQEAERKLYRERTLPTLGASLRDRYARLEETFRQIEAQRQDKREWFDEAFQKLEYLQEKFVLFAQKQMQFQSYLEELRGDIGTNAKPRRLREDDHRSASSLKLVSVSDYSERWTQAAVSDIQAHYESELTELTELLSGEEDDTTRLVLQKRLDVLTRRNEFVGKIGKILTNLNHQLRLVEDTFGLINDELRARSPEQILADVEEVVVATEYMSSTLEEIASVEQMIGRVAS